MLSVTADSNIWISAFNYRGKPRLLVEIADAGEVRIDISEGICGLPADFTASSPESGSL